ncbi:hypothetical protein LRP88_12691 [Fusarium phalaenopsidis]
MNRKPGWIGLLVSRLANRRLLLSHWTPSSPGRLRILISALTTVLISYNVSLGIVSVSFYLVAGSEIHWRNIGFVADPAARTVLLSGLMTFIVVVALAICERGGYYQLPQHNGHRYTKDDDEKSSGAAGTTRTALIKSSPCPWMPKDSPLAGFEDWYTDETHYSAAADPLKISNLDEPLLKELRGKLKDISIRHVVIILLESTRSDVFPIKKDGLIWNRFADTWPDGKLPLEVQDKMASLTPTANFITGDYDDGFEHEEKRNSMVGTVCGVAPLVGDFNLEYSHHIYQPCLPHVFEALNKAGDSKTEPNDKESSWKSYYFQAATLDYDNQNSLMAAMGFPKNIPSAESTFEARLQKHGPVTLPNINEFAFEEDPLKTTSAIFCRRRQNKRPTTEKYTQMAKGLDMMSRYINTEGYDDRWIRKILNLLDEQGVANETLVMFLGDRCLLPENNFASPYYNPNIGVDHVPLVLSHPQLPAFDSHGAVQSSQSQKAAADLIRNYEGQSLLRELNVVNDRTGQGQWQFTVTNPGRAMLTVRDARYPERHLVVPVIENVEWRLSNLTSDPHELNSVQNFDFVSFLQGVEEMHGREWAEWVEEGAFITRWFVKENSKRWRFDHKG